MFAISMFAHFIASILFFQKGSLASLAHLLSRIMVNSFWLSSCLQTLGDLAQQTRASQPLAIKPAARIVKSFGANIRHLAVVLRRAKKVRIRIEVELI